MFKKVAIVTGCAGFIGLTFTRKLLEKGWKVYGIDKFTYVADREELKNLTLQFSENFEFNEQDIVDLDWIPECDVIFNLAAESDVDVGNLNSLILLGQMLKELETFFNSSIIELLSELINLFSSNYQLMRCTVI